MTINRRHFIQGSGTFAGAMLCAPAVLAQAKPKVVVIGGGAGGATAAKYIAKESAGGIAVTLIEPNAKYTTCFHSNLYLGGFRNYASITHGYDALKKKHGIAVVASRADKIDRDKKEVILAGGKKLSYDRLVVSPGIDLKYDSVPGWSQAAEEIFPHAWKPGAQTQLLKKKLDAVPNGGVIVVIAPPNPYRCPPGPYERISMMAHVLKQAKKDRSKIIVLDAKETFSKQALFQEGWDKHYKGMVQWLSPKVYDGIKSVDPKTGTIVTGFETYKNVALCNVIPAQHAGAIARDAQLANASGYCAIDPASMKSSVDANIYVLGDASIAGDMPKSAFSANSQAKVAANAIRGELVSARVFPARFSNTCWSLIETDDCVKIGGAYEPKDGKITASSTFLSKTGEDAGLRKQTQAENMDWYAAITQDIFA